MFSAGIALTLFMYTLIVLMFALVLFWVVRLGVRFGLRDHSRWLDSGEGCEGSTGTGIL